MSPNSIISQFNQSETGIELGAALHFRTNLACANEVFETSDGAFDASVMPLVNFWGFGYTNEKQDSQVDTAEVVRILQLLGMDQVDLKGDSVIKKQAATMLDFSACAKGYGVDQVAGLLEKNGLDQYLVDIGGESRAKGKKPNGELWRVGINVPDEDAAFDEIMTAFSLEDRSVATSGNYRNWYEVDGVKYSHTMNPKTGFPERTNILSASAFHQDCMMADAYATASMVLGVEKALSLAESLPDLELYVIYSSQMVAWTHNTPLDWKLYLMNNKILKVTNGCLSTE